MKPHFITIIQALFVVFLWATSWVFIKFGLQELPPLVFAGLRYTLAVICLGAVLLVRKGRYELKAIKRHDLARLVILGVLLYACTQGAAYIALAYLPAVTVNLLWSFSSILVALLGIAWLAERPSLLQWGGILFALFGAFIYFYPVSIPSGQVFGVFVAFLGIVANAVSAILGRGINRSNRLSPLVVTVVSMGAGSLVLLSVGVLVEGLPVIGLKSWGIIAWLAVVNTAFAFTLWNHTLRSLPAMESSIINGTMLIWIPIFAVLLLGEQISPQGILGLIAVGLGTLIVQLRRQV